MRNHKSASVGLAIAALCAGALALAAPGKAQVWQEQGPGPICNGGATLLPDMCDAADTVMGGKNPVTGAINAIAPGPTDSDVIFAGTVSGGVWKTSNATAAIPTWTPLTDNQLPQLPINSLAMSPVNSQTLFAGTGSTTSFLRFGSLGIGVARSIDGGTTWTVRAGSTFAGRAINSIVPTTLNGGQTVLAATWLDGGGVYRSTDNAVTFTRISGNGTSGLPDAGVTSLVADQSNASRFYAGVPGGAGGGALAGVYRSGDGGVTWTAVNTGLSGLATSLRILLAVHSGSAFGDNAVYADVIAADGTLSGVFRSANQGGSWTSLGVPSPPIYPGKQGATNGALAAHPSNANVVFISGDRQDGPFPNGNGCSTFVANVFRWNGTAWHNVVCAGANTTAPHPDSRFMAFDAGGNLLQTDDGGIVRLPNTATRKWVAIDGNIRSAEFHSIAYDRLSNIVFGGTQDNGTAVQKTPGNFTWMGLLAGDGGVVGVDASNPTESLRYSSFQDFGFFNRSRWDATNTMLSQVAVGLNITSGPGKDMTLFQFDKNIQFYQPFALNAIDPSRMLIGTNQLYESLNKGDSLNNLGCLTPLVMGQCVGALVGSGQGYGQPIAYGSRLAGVAMPDVFYVGAGATIFHRVVGGLITKLASYPGGTVITIAMNPNNYKQVYVSDLNNKVWGSSDEGATWSNMTFNLPTLSGLTGLVTTIEVFSPDATLANTVVIGGGFGVFQLPATGTNWTALTGLANNLPPALVLDLHYDYTDSVLVAGTLGRGSWTIAGPFSTNIASGLIARSKALPRPNGPVSSLPLLRHLPPAPPPSANVPP
jgi:hypothetical protein